MIRQKFERISLSNAFHGALRNIRMGRPFSRLGEVAAGPGKGLIAAGSGGVERNGTFDRAVESLKAVENASAECSGVEPNPRIVSVARGAKRVRRGRAPRGCWRIPM
jgi:alcohol dehydrogenase class IV